MAENTPSGKDTAVKEDMHLSSCRLKAVNRTSALMAGFAMVSMVELSIPDSKEYRPPEWMVVAHATCTTLLVAVNLLALMIGMYVLPNIEVAINVTPPNPSSKNDQPQYSMKTYVKIAWYCSASVGTALFMIEICLLCWVKFHDVSYAAAIVSSCLMVPVCGVFVAFVVHYHRGIGISTSSAIKSQVMELTKPGRG